MPGRSASVLKKERKKDELDKQASQSISYESRCFNPSSILTGFFGSHNVWNQRLIQHKI